MPELPEVETTVRSIAPFLLNRTIAKVEVLRTNMVGNAKKFEAAVTQRTVVEIRRRGKYMLVHFENDTTMILHLKMSGRLGLRKKKDPPLTFERIRFHVSKDTLIIFNDPRTLGRATVIPTADVAAHPPIKLLGPEALEIGEKEFLARLEKRPNRAIKELLMDQAFVDGVGNIYAQEACFLAKIDPRRRVKSLSTKERAKIFQGMRAALEKGVLNMGTSISDFADVFGKPGRNQDDLLVYGRTGKPCRVCKAVIKSCVQAQRTTAFCMKCQR